ncbi:MAG: pentapeptide repeat-containing protein [Alphaproteobacteria bacterium]
MVEVPAKDVSPAEADRAIRSEARSDEAEVKEQIAKLIEAANDTAKVCRAQLAALLLVVLYLGITLLSTNDEALLRGSEVKLPQLNTGLSLRQSYLWAPVVFVFLHVALLINLDLLAAKLRGLNQLLDRLGSDGVREYYRLLLAPFTFTQVLAGPREGSPVRWLVEAFTWLAIVAVPLGLILAAQISFVRYHDAFVTHLHQVLVTIELAALAFFLTRFRGGRTATTPKSRAWRLTKWSTLAVAVLLILKLSWLDASIPDHRYEFSLKARAFNLIDLLCHDCRNLTVSGRILVNELPGPEIVALYLVRGLSGQVAAREQSSGLNLGGRDLRFAHLVGDTLYRADLNFADLRGAFLTLTHLEEASLLLAQLNGASFLDAHLSKVDLSHANLTDADLMGADLTDAKLYDADLSGAQLSSANLSGADLHDAKNVWQGQLDGACGDDRTNLPPGFTIKHCKPDLKAPGR